MIDSQQTPRRRATDYLLWALWLGVIIGFAAVPVSIHLRFGGNADRNKDYDTWYLTGQRLLAGEEIYPLEELPRFKFMYPPPAAAMILPLAAAGRLPFILLCETLNACCWVFCVYAGVHLATGSAWRRPALMYLVPTLATTAYVYDTFLLGQPNLILLAILLGGFICLRRRCDFAAGGLVALATAIKAFPVMLVVYFLWRRQTRAVTGFVVTLALLLLVFPAPIRGFQRNIADVGTWINGMVLSYDKGTIAQRPGQSYRWKNASLVATANRLLRHVPADRKAYIHPPPRIPHDPNAGYHLIYANLAELDFATVNVIILLAAAAIGLGFIIAMPPQRQRTWRTDTIEYAMLLVMVLIFSPISWFYYGVWLMYPLTIVMRFILDVTTPRRAKRFAIAGLTVALIAFNFVPSWDWFRPYRAIGTPFFGYVLLLTMLGGMLWRERRRAATNFTFASAKKSMPPVLSHAA